MREKTFGVQMKNERRYERKARFSPCVDDDHLVPVLVVNTSENFSSLYPQLPTKYEDLSINRAGLFIVRYSYCWRSFHVHGENKLVEQSPRCITSCTVRSMKYKCHTVVVIVFDKEGVLFRQ